MFYVSSENNTLSCVDIDSPNTECSLEIKDLQVATESTHIRAEIIYYTKDGNASVLLMYQNLYNRLVFMLGTGIGFDFSWSWQNVTARITSAITVHLPDLHFAIPCRATWYGHWQLVCLLADESRRHISQTTTNFDFSWPDNFTVSYDSFTCK